MGCAFIMDGENKSFFNCSYTSFGNLRKFVAKKLGINLEEMEFFGGKKKWSDLPLTNIHLLFSFKDCSGDLDSRFVEKLAIGLSLFMDSCEPQEIFKNCGFLESDLRAFINGLRIASDLGRKVSIH